VCDLDPGKVEVIVTGTPIALALAARKGQNTQMPLETLPSAVDDLLKGAGAPAAHLQAALDTIAREFDARTATLHFADIKERTLHMVAQRGIPDHIAAITRQIPFGKGMAGICAERLAPVEVCNVQADDSGQSRPGAKETGVAGAIVVPVMERGRLVGTLGIGKPEEHEYSDTEKKTLEDCAARLAATLGHLRFDK
jgi:L-methionine (R)-S-oxide reductase